MTTRWNEMTTSIGLLILRLGAGGFLITHGWGKAQQVLAGDFGNFVDPFGIGTGPSLVLAAGAEFGCSILVVLGLATRFAAVPVVVTMLVAAFIAHSGDPWTMGEGARLFAAGEAESWASKEPALLFLFSFLTLTFTGAGKFSLDGVIWPRWRARRQSR